MDDSERRDNPEDSEEAPTTLPPDGGPAMVGGSTVSLPSGARSPIDERWQDKPFQSERYALRETIGEGGMATVVEADDRRLGRTVAVKRMKSPLSRDAKHRRRFVKEAKILAGLPHPGTVAIFDLGGEDDAPFYAMERVHGKTLGELLNPRTEEEIRDRQGIAHYVDILERVCRTMAFAHSKGVLHRDLKPSNIMVDDDYGTVLVMDWGIAKRVGAEDERPTPGASPSGDDPEDDRTRAGMVFGTPGYMSPEQARGTADASYQTDVFALGVILYTILTGKKPFVGRTNRDTARAVVSHDPPAPETVNSRAGRELSAICMKALEKDPAERYPSAREMAEDLRRFREFRPVSCVRPRSRDRIVYWVQRHKMLAASLATLLAGLLVVGSLVGMQKLVEKRIVDFGLGAIEESYADVQRHEVRLAALRERHAGLPAGSAARRLAERELDDVRAAVATAQLTLRGRVGGLIGLTFTRPHPRAIELGRWQAVRLIEMMVELEDYPMAVALARSTIEQSERLNILELSAADLAQVRTLQAFAEAEIERERTGEDRPARESRP